MTDYLVKTIDAAGLVSDGNTFPDYPEAMVEAQALLGVGGIVGVKVVQDDWATIYARGTGVGVEVGEFPEPEDPDEGMTEADLADE